MLRDPERLAELAATGLLDSEAEESFDRLTRLAARLTHAPVALVSLVDADRQFIKSCVGFAEPWGGTREVPLSHSFCQHAVNSGQPLIIEDARQHPLVCENPAIRDFGVVAYAGVPLITRHGQVLGTFCALDYKPRHWTDEEIQTLKDLAASVMTEIELRYDVRERMRAEAALRENEARFRNIVENASDIIFGIDAFGFFTYVNPVAAKVMGFPSDQLVGMHFTTLVREDARDDIVAFYRKQFQERIETTYYEFPTVSAHGREVWIGQNVRLVLEDDHIVGAQAVARDITARHEIERVKDELVSIVSHELRTPLTSLRGSLGLMATGRLSAEQMQRMLDVAVGNTDRLIRLINDFLDLERIRAGLKLALREIDLASIVESAVQNVAAEAARLNVSVEADATTDLVHVDPDQMVQVAVNLLSNAIKFSEPNSVVRIVARRHGDEMVMEVSDQGRGIPRDMLSAIFEPFHQVDASDSRDKGGTGLGLPIVKSIVEQHGGTVSVDSDAGKGAAFTVRIPN